MPKSSTPGPSQLVEWLKERLPGEEVALHQEMALWKNGSLLCSLVNSVVPEACLNPHCHFGHPPEHGQALAYKYLGVKPVIKSQFNKIKTSLIRFFTKSKSRTHMVRPSST